MVAMKTPKRTVVASDARTPMSASWQFFAVTAATASGFMWQWEKRSAEEILKGAAFAFYFDCISDARDNGYAGPLPAGPKVPLTHLQIGRVEPAGASSLLPARRNAGEGVLSVTAVSAVDSKRRRTRGGSRAV